MITVPVHEVDFGGIDFTGRTDYDGVTFHALAKESSLGNPVPVTRDILTPLVDGTYSVLDGHGNREPTMWVMVKAANSLLVKRGQAMLFQAASKPADFGYKHPDGFSPREILRAYTSHLQHAFDDIDELRVIRTFNLTMNCDPWWYAEEPVVTIASEAAPITPATTTISDGTSATGWTSPPGVTAPAVSSGKLRITPRAAGIEGTYVSEATRTLSATDFSATPFLTADIKPETGMTLFPIEEGSAGITYIPGYSKGGIDYPQVVNYDDGSQRGNPAAWAGAYVDDLRLTLTTLQTLSDGTVRYTWRCDDTSATTVRFVVGTRNAGGSPSNFGFLLDNVTRSNVNAAQTTSGRASLRSIVALGSARTASSLAIEHPTSALGEVFILTTSARAAAGFGGPSLQPWISGETLTADTSAVSGSYSTMTDGATDPMRWSVPANQLPSQSYLLLTRVRSGSGTAPKTATFTVSQIEGSTEFGEVADLATVSPVAAGGGGAGAWTALTVLGVVTLPRQKAPAESAAAVQIEMTADGPGSSNHLHVDNLWAIPVDENSSYSWVDCGSGSVALGTNHNRLYLDTATPVSPSEGIYVGTAAYRADAFCPGYPAIKAWGTHPFEPGANKLFVITTNARNPVITGTYTPASF